MTNGWQLDPRRDISMPDALLQSSCMLTGTAAPWPAASCSTTGPICTFGWISGTSCTALPHAASWNPTSCTREWVGE